jgi:hypothetical protein
MIDRIIDDYNKRWILWELVIKQDKISFILL